MDAHITSNPLLISIPDPTDWDTTTLPLLHPLDSALRCQICKDFFTAPLITACLHTFCSECIRRALHADKICPICRTSEQEYRLRKNQVVEDLVDAFLTARPQLLDVARRVPVEGSSSQEEGDEGEDEIESSGGGGPAKKKVRASSRGKRSRSSPKYVEVVEEEKEEEEGGGRVGDIVKISTQNDGLVPCPSCNKRIKMEAVNSHLDSCLSDEYRPPSPMPLKSSFAIKTYTTRSKYPPSLSTYSSLHPSETLTFPSNPPSKPLGIPSQSLQPLPKINYSMIKERDLRSKLTALGIPSQGTRKLLQERHSEWMTIWNANVDAKRPRSKAELLTELNSWEKANLKPSNKIVKEKWSDEQWQNNYKPQFEVLIEEAKERVAEAKRKRLEIEAKEKVKGEGKNEGEVEAGGAQSISLILNRNEVSMTTVDPALGFSPVASHMSQENRESPNDMDMGSQHNGKRKFIEIDGSSAPVTETV